VTGVVIRILFENTDFLAVDKPEGLRRGKS
jgi:23S rRNA-/tRNA-specific pseudouridylate synthase